MLNLDQAQAEIIKQIRPATETEELVIAQALGRFLAQPVYALVDNPAFSNSAMDGYALNHGDLAKNDFCLALAGESRCGIVPTPLTPGHCMRIFTGAPIPAGADTIVIQENISKQKTNQIEKISFPENVQTGSNIRKQGEDFKLNDSLYEIGHRLQAHDLALLSTAGIAKVSVFRRPKILVIATGDELVTPGEKLKPGQIYESNRLTTILMLQEMGAEVTDGGTAADDVDSVRAILANADRKSVW